jgi:hypothetical protein
MSDDPTPEDEEEIHHAVAKSAEARNLNDQASENKQRKRVDNEAELASRFWRGVFSTPVGRREMWGLLKACQPNGDPFDVPFACGPNGFPQDQATFVRLGQYQIGQMFFQSWLKLDLEGTILMLRENSDRFPKPRKG